MRILTLLAILGLGASAYLAPRHFEARLPSIVTEGLLEDGFDALVELADRDKALGVLYRAHEESGGADGRRGRFRAAVMLWAVAPAQPDLNKLLRAEIEGYLKDRKTIDPDGSWLNGTLNRWIELRLDNEQMFYSNVSTALWLAARGDERGARKLMYFANKGPFHLEVFPYLRRIHPRWEGIRALVEHYLVKGDLVGRVEAATTLLEYHNLWGVGADLLERHRTEILRDLKESRVHHAGHIEFRSHPAALLPAFALIGKEGIAAIGAMRDVHAGQAVEFLRIARMWAGLVPFSRLKIGGTSWELLDSVSRRFYFRASYHRLAMLTRRLAAEKDEGKRAKLAAELESVRKVTEAGLLSTDTLTVSECFSGLLAADARYAEELPRRYHEGGGVLSLYSAGTIAVDDPVPTFLPALISPEPEYSSMAAVMLIDIKNGRATVLQGPN